MIIVTSWETYTENGTQFRKRTKGNKLEVQQRVIQTEFSRQRLISKARAGLYDLEDMKICGTGNTFMIHGWVNVPHNVHSCK